MFPSLRRLFYTMSNIGYSHLWLQERICVWGTSSAETEGHGGPSAVEFQVPSQYKFTDLQWWFLCTVCGLWPFSLLEIVRLHVILVLQAQLQTLSARWKKKECFSCNFLGTRAKPKLLESKQKVFAVGPFFPSVMDVKQSGKMKCQLICSKCYFG